TCTVVLLPQQLSLRSAPLATLLEIVQAYASRCSFDVWATHTTLAADALCRLGQFYAAVHVYRAVLARVAPSADKRQVLVDGVPVADASVASKFVPTLSHYIRAMQGFSVASASAARAYDAQCDAASTVRRLLRALNMLQSSAALVLEQALPLREAMYHHIFNASVYTLTIGEALMQSQAAFARLPLPFLSFAILSLERTATLSAPKFLPWRLQLYGCLTRAYDRAGVVALTPFVTKPTVQEAAADTMAGGKGKANVSQCG
ncbi:MAG: DUF4486 domain-containing protein, partial [Proteobacteria bacterium]